MLKRLMLLALLLPALAAAGPLSAQDEADLNYEAFVLDNGLEVILVEDNSAPVVAIDVWYRVGSANDPAGRSGFAHLFEHMMFQGTANLSKDDLQRLLFDAGGRFNAYTGRDQTVYYEYLPSHQLPLGLWLEADRMASLAVTQTNLDNQRAVVIQEFQQNYGGTPYGPAMLELLQRPFTYPPYQRAPIGAVEDVNQATILEVTAFHATYYVPNNATLVIAGDLDKATARRLVEQYFGRIPAGDEPPALPEWQPAQQGEAEILNMEDDLIRNPAVLVGYETPPRGSPDYPAIQLLDYLLGTGDSARLRQNLVDTGAAFVANTIRSTNIGPGMFGVLILPNTRLFSREEVEQLFYAEIDRIIAEGVPQEELDKAINIMRSRQIANLETAFGLAEAVQSAVRHYGDPRAVFTEIDRFRAVTPADIQRVATEYLAPADRHVIYVDPGSAQPTPQPVPFVGAVGNATDDAFTVDFALPFTEPPEPLAIRELSLPDFTETMLPNGLKVIVVESPELPTFSADLVFRGGGSLVAPEQFGLAGMTAELLTRGTETRSAADIANTMEGRGGGVGAGASLDLLSIGAFSLIEDRALTVELLADMVLNPSFPQQEIDVRLDQIRAGIDEALADPAAQVGRIFSPAVYGDHPYGRIITAESLAAIDRDAIVGFYERIVHPANAFLILAGQLTTEEAMALAETYFGDWQGVGEPPAVEFPPIDNGITGVEILLVDIPGAEQAEVAIGNVGIRGNDPVRYQLQVVDNVLGEGLSSRLQRSLREEKGYAYSVGSGLSLPVDFGIFQIGATVQTSAAADAIREALFEVQRIRTEPIGIEELEAVRGGMIGRFALNLETLQDLVNAIGGFLVRDLPLADIVAYPARIAATDPQGLLAAAAAYLPEDFLVVVAGRAEELRPQLEAIGAVTMVEPR